MIKTLVILALLVVLAGGMFLSRPSEQSFKAHYREQMKQEKGNFFEKFLREGAVDSYLNACTYKNRFLWADVEKDGQVVYTGVFSQWFARGATKEATPAK